MKAATNSSLRNRETCSISIHAAREGGDAAFGQHVVCNRIFQSTPPVKAATVLSAFSSSIATFQSTPPVKAATPSSQFLFLCYLISIHAAREGGDAKLKNITTADGNFNPRRP